MKAKRQAGRILSNEKGFVLPLAFIFLSIIALLGATALVSTTTDLKIAANYKTSVQAFYLAEAGVASARQQLKQNWNAITPGGRYFGVGRYDYTIINPNPNLRIIESTGMAGGGKKVIEVSVMLGLPMPPLPSTIYMDGNNTIRLFGDHILNLSGNDTTYFASGSIHHLTGWTEPGPNPPVYAITIDKGATLTKKVIGNVNITGGPPGSTGSIGYASESIDIASLASQYISIADRTITGDHLVVDGPWGNPDIWWCSTNNILVPANPQVSYVSGDMKVHGNFSGAGMLIVRGDLRIHGNFRWIGIIILLDGGVVRCRWDHAYEIPARGNIDIFGALLTQGDNPDKELDVNFRGNVNIFHSSQAISMVGELAPPAGIAVSSWREM